MDNEAYIIKNDNDKYWCFDLSKIHANTWSWWLFDAKFYYDERDAEKQARKIRDARTPCKVIKVKIKEVKND